ncbi:hypothetical protein JFV28_20625 [Pseudomonas sp. TH05]|uniref:hypothetical protein n=1 Tax=unclassified Pseudomonas TaxID=196821 RepID=UPI000997AB7E|nr:MULTISPECIES: hypothetical protein [unclassified Pseudomonas]MBK5541471.1 hypothetical protein [Pseudomonas sp. TH07]MBK5558250.1 hypothetical protein [Pseudomonas sp. TH05]OOV91470.1 hypothetical protein MF4836_27990 [Pseudomonas sp. MF4836]
MSDRDSSPPLGHLALNPAVRAKPLQLLTDIQRSGSLQAAQIAIMKLDLMGDDELLEFLSYPHHEIVISENVTREFHTQRLSELRRDPRRQDH